MSWFAPFNRPNGHKTIEDLEFLIAAINVQNDRIEKLTYKVKNGLSHITDALDRIEAKRDQADDNVDSP